ncbi:MAG: sigma-70 family RNA polymerase sigma factor [Tahibacter sp.]
MVVDESIAEVIEPAAGIGQDRPDVRATTHRHESRMTSEPTEHLLQRIRAGDPAARQRLYDRYRPLLQRWAHGRLPQYARDINDTEDLVQISLLRALEHLTEFEARGPGSFLAYLRQILLNQVRLELRARRRHGRKVDIEAIELVQSNATSAVEMLVGAERLRAYEEALSRLDRRVQELIVLRLEFGLSYQQMAAEIGGTPDAIRMTLARALRGMAESLAHEKT